MKNTQDIQYLYEDESIVIVSKPAGVLTIPDRYNKELPNLRRILEKKYGKIFVVHRLDRDTSGVMVFLKNADAHRILNEQFQNNEVEKIYNVVVSGIVPREEIDIDIPIIADPVKLGMSRPSARGKESLTKVKVIERYRVATLIECDLVTGRHHQIRVHCAAVGHPLLVDELYGQNTEFYLSSIKRKFNLKKHTVENPIINRVTMHSTKISFLHPDTNEKVTFEAPFPKDFQALLNVLRKYSAVGRNFYSPSDILNEDDQEFDS